jgi:hypothetical protein
VEVERDMAGREDGGNAGAMEEGRGGGEASSQGSEDRSSIGTTNSRCSGNEMLSVQFMQKVRMACTTLLTIAIWILPTFPRTCSHAAGSVRIAQRLPVVLTLTIRHN